MCRSGPAVGGEILKDALGRLSPSPAATANGPRGSPPAGDGKMLRGGEPGDREETTSHRFPREGPCGRHGLLHGDDAGGRTSPARELREGQDRQQVFRWDGRDVRGETEDCEERGMKALTPVKAIRAKCLECAGSRKRVHDCDRGPEASEPCPLHPYRMGRNPARTGIGRALTAESARITRKRTSQVVVSADKKSLPHGSTPETILGHPRANNGEVDLSAISPRERRRIKEAALAILFGPGPGGNSI